MVGRRSPQTPSINRLTSLPDSVISKCWRSRHAEFQHIKRRHQAAYRGGCQACQNLPKERYAMSRDTTVIAFRQPEAIDDPLSELAREGARRMLAQVLIAEADSFVALWKDLRLPDGRDRVVRHGHGPNRAIQTGVVPVEVRRGKVRDRGDVGAEEKIRFTSSILPKWARRTKSLDALLPVLYF